MNQGERRRYLLNELIKELPREERMNIPFDSGEQWELLRSLFSRRQPKPVSADFLRVQNEFLQEASIKRGIVNLIDLKQIKKNIYLWKGDVTTLSCGAIVNSASPAMTGPFRSSPNCLDNSIHTFAGIQLRAKCQEITAGQGQDLPDGEAVITPAYNLPCDYIIHTLAPRISMRVRHKDEETLASCYRSCLELADHNGIDSIAFPSIATGEFSFPNELAAKIASFTVYEYLVKTGSSLAVIFNVYSDTDLEIYKRLL